MFMQTNSAISIGHNVDVDDGRNRSKVFGMRDLKRLRVAVAAATARKVSVRRRGRERGGEVLEVLDSRYQVRGRSVRGAGQIVRIAVRVAGERLVTSRKVATATAGISVVALALALYYKSKDTGRDLQHSGQVHVVVDGQQVAIFVRIANVELDAIEAVKTFDELIKVLKLANTGTS